MLLSIWVQGLTLDTISNSSSANLPFSIIMNRERFSSNYRLIVIALGGMGLLYALVNLGETAIDGHFILFLLFAFFLAPFMNLKLPRGNLALGFSDSLIVLCFLFYGGKAAVVTAAIEMLSNCLSLKRNGMTFRKWLIPFNIAVNAVSTIATIAILTSAMHLFQIETISAETSSLLPIIGLFALLQFLSTSILHAPASKRLPEKAIWKIWTDDFFSGSLAHIAGAAVAFTVYKLLNYGNLLTTVVAFALIAIGYINYRRTIADISDSIEQAETAEREKAEIARLKADEAEKHAEELSILLKKEEEISEDLRRNKEELEYSAFHDKLTDLPNRAYLIERLKFLLELGMELSKEYYVVFLDLSRFKNINDSLGHSVGDQVLKIVALRLKRLLRDEDSITRLGGDEFALILTHLSSIEKAQKVADKIYETITRPFMVNGNKIYSDLHVGIAPLDYEHVKPEDVIRDANIAMQYAKVKNIGVATFDKKIRSNHLERIRLEADLKTAIERDEFSMNYQPIISLQTGEVAGFEALIRWIHPELGFVSPADFIPISEESGSIILITNWILKETCSQMAKWNKLHEHAKQLYVSVNISGRHLAEDDLVRDIQMALRLSGLPAENLKLEITESSAMENAERTIQTLTNINHLGVQLSIDDFGTGYSSLSYLHRLPFSTLKIDRSFVTNAGTGNKEDLKILETIVSLAKNLNKSVVAEGIETEKELSLLQNLECKFGQGYLFSKPLQKSSIPELIENMKPWLEFNKVQGAAGDRPNIPVNDNLHPF